MRVLTILLFASCLLVSCSESSIVDTTTPILNETPSPFEDFLGTWQLASELIDGEPNSIGRQIMYIEEDDDLTDSNAIGYYEGATPDSRKDMLVKLTENENEIIFEKGSRTFICTYQFNGKKFLQFDDSNQVFGRTEIQTWKRR